MSKLQERALLRTLEPARGDSGPTRAFHQNRQIIGMFLSVWQLLGSLTGKKRIPLISLLLDSSGILGENPRRTTQARDNHSRLRHRYWKA